MDEKCLLCCVYSIVVLLVHLRTGSCDVLVLEGGSEQGHHRGREIGWREDVGMVSSRSGLPEDSELVNRHNQGLPQTDVAARLPQTRSGDVGNGRVASPPSFHPGTQRVLTKRTSESGPVPSFCLQTPDDNFCGQATKRYYFNTRTRECHKFIYGGCEGKYNTFETLADCNLACVGHA